jgi:hypothetical protein
MSADHVTIERLTVQLSNRQATSETASAARLQIAHFLNDIDWQPSGYRPGQVWVIRRLAQLPALNGQGEHTWVAAVERALDDLFRRALRVQPGQALGSATEVESVLFADRADWLALLTAETLRGSVWARWYWGPLPAASPGCSPGALLAGAWSRYAEHLPAALDLLPSEQGERAMDLLAPGEVSRVVRALHERYTLPSDIFAVTAAEENSTKAGTLPPAAPWEQWAMPHATLKPQACYLYGLVRTLRLAPGYAGSARFARAAAAWLEDRLVREADEGPAAGVEARRHGYEGTTRQDDGAGVSGEQQSKNERGTAGMAQSSGPLTTIVEGSATAATTVAGRDEALHRGETAGEEVSRTEVPGETVPAVRGRGGEANTGLGGVLFLIHALAWLDLPALHGGAIGGWAWVELFARALLTVETDVEANDSIWGVLRSLDGRRKGEPIGAGWTPEEFRLSRRTVMRYLAGEWRGEVRLGRLRLTRGEVLVLDAPAAGAGDMRLGDEHRVQEAIRAYTGDAATPWEWGGLPGVGVGLALGETASQVERDLRQVADGGAVAWLTHALPCFLYLMRRALGDAALPVEEIARRVLRQRGWLEVTRTHIDLFLPLKAADVALRRAGLDRNPGWLPEYGYIVQWHYE